MAISVAINLSLLVFFKYYNFFIFEFSSLLSSLGVNTHFWSLQIILPVGISFYTFHGLSYIIDVYHRRIQTVDEFIPYAVFVSYFPLLVAGPIERANHLLPQLLQPRQFNYSQAVKGIRQILWGLFKKVVIADNCATYANLIFNNSNEYYGIVLLLGAVFFAFQIYGDFSGYSDIALGVSNLLGIELLKNFAYPYFSRDIAEFWRRWHISLSSWFRDYVYIPLGGSKGTLLTRIRNTFIIFLLSGFWHGANWTFVFWGALNAFYFLPFLLTGRNRNNLEIVAANQQLPTAKEFIQILFTFSLTTIAWIFFRAENLHHAFSYIQHMLNGSLFLKPTIFPVYILVLIVLFIIIEWNGRKSDFALASLCKKWPRLLRWSFYFVLFFMVLVFAGKQEQFIYFQF